MCCVLIQVCDISISYAENDISFLFDICDSAAYYLIENTKNCDEKRLFRESSAAIA